MHSLFRATALVALLGLAACPGPALPDGGSTDAGGDDDAGAGAADAGDAGEAFDAGPPDAGFGPVDITAFCQTQAFARCARDVRCGRLEAARLDACMRRDLEACDQTALSSGVAFGRLEYFAAQGGACLDAYGSTPCWDTRAPALCDGLMQGLVPPDGGCLLPEECQSGSFCQVYLQTCPFRCFAKAELGATCNWWDRQCDDQAATCVYDGGVNTCVPRVGVGEACTWSSDCRADLACSNGHCVKSSATLGEACNLANGYPYCDAEGFCRTVSLPDGGAPGTCQKRVGLGGACVGYNACLPNLRCSSNLQTGTCVPLGNQGDTCTGYGECKSELFCWTRTSSCTAHWPDGGDCTSRGSDYSCAPGFFCDYNAPNGAYVCRASKALGESCSYDGVCQSKSCETGRLADGGSGLVCTLPCSKHVDGGF
jgi:hypothetical protein